MSKLLQTIKEKKINIMLASMILFIVPLLRINLGVDITDTGYSLGNFENFSNMEGMWVLATYLANALGHFFTLLPMGHTMIGMNFYTGLLVSGSMVIAFLSLRKILPGMVVFLGEILAFFLCWCPTAIIYNYLTYFFMLLALLFIYKGLLQDKNWFLVAAGFLLGLNVFVRFPNLVQMGFIVVVWVDGIWRKSPLKKVIYRTLSCMAGYAMSILLLLGVTISQYGVSGYKDMLFSLQGVSTSIQGYSPIEMILAVLRAYYQNIKWTWIIILFVVVMQLVYSICKKKALKIGICVALGIGVLAILYFYYRNGLFYSFIYNEYPVMFFWAAFFLVQSIGIAVALLIKKDQNRSIKILACMSLLVLALTPLGSNNGIYTNFNNIFLIAPVTLYGYYVFFLQKEKRGKRMPIALAIMTILLITFFQCGMFKLVFTFRDIGLGAKLNTKIEINDRLRGMVTNEENAKILEEVTVYIFENELQKQNVLLFGEAPMLSYCLEMDTKMGSTWPDLLSFTMDDFVAGLTRSKGSLVIIRKETYPVDLRFASDLVDEKAKKLQQFLLDNEYTIHFENDGFILYSMNS